MSFYETREMHKKEYLRTRYFIANYDQMFNLVLKIAKERGYHILDQNYERKEIFIEGDCSMVITITSFGREQGVDINCDTYSFFDFGKGKRRIKEFYEAIGREVQYKGSGLHAWEKINWLD